MAELPVENHAEDDQTVVDDGQEDDGDQDDTLHNQDKCIQNGGHIGIGHIFGENILNMFISRQ